MIIPVHGTLTPTSDDAKRLAGQGPEYYLDAANIKFTETESVSRTLLSLLERLAGHSMEDLIGRILLLENTLFSEIDSNSFTIRLDSLDGLEVTGTWNPTLARLEC